MAWQRNRRPHVKTRHCAVFVIRSRQEDDRHVGSRSLGGGAYGESVALGQRDIEEGKAERRFRQQRNRFVLPWAGLHRIPLRNKQRRKGLGDGTIIFNQQYAHPCLLTMFLHLAF